MDLVHDHPADASEHRSNGRGQHQIQRLWRGDQDVGWIPLHSAAVLLRGVARTQKGLQLGERITTETFGGVPDTGEWGSQIAVDVVSKGLHGGDVEDPASLRPFRDRLGEKLIQGPEKGSEGLPRPCGCVDQRVIAITDGRPSPGLRPGWSGKGGLEPRPRCWRESLQRIHTRKVSGDGDKKMTEVRQQMLSTRRNVPMRTPMHQERGN